MELESEEKSYYNEAYAKNNENILKNIKDALNEMSPGTVVLENENYADAIMGMTEDFRLIYSYDKMIEHLMILYNWTMEEAMEWIDYNTVRALPYMGENHPIICYDIPV